MNVTQLKARLQQEGISPGSYSIGGPLPSFEGLVLKQSGDTWTIEHVERGMRRELESHASEAQACARMYELLVQHFR